MDVYAIVCGLSSWYLCMLLLLHILHSRFDMSCGSIVKIQCNSFVEVYVYSNIGLDNKNIINSLHSFDKKWDCDGSVRVK